MAANIPAHSEDSHHVDPDDLWKTNLPPQLTESTTHSRNDDDEQWETVSRSEVESGLGRRG